MVHFHVEGHQSALQAFDDMHLPQRMVAIHQFRVQACGAALKLQPVAWTRQLDTTHVVVEIDLTTVRPDRVGEVQRHLRQPAPVERRQIQAAHQQPPDLAVEIALVTFRQIEDMKRTDMHWRLGRFEMQESPVESAQCFHGCLQSAVTIQMNTDRPCALATPARSASSVTMRTTSSTGQSSCSNSSVAASSSPT